MPRIDLVVPFHEKDEAKKLGARWDPQKKVWFVPDGTDAGPLRRWVHASRDINVRSGKYFILTTRRTCWKCDTPTTVFAFALPAGHQTLEFENDAEQVGSWQDIDISALPHYIGSLSDSVRNRIQTLTPHFRLDFSKTTNSWYWMNHCEHCGMKHGDFELFCEPEVAFMPLTAQSTKAIQIEEILEPFEALAGGYMYEPEFL